MQLTIQQIGIAIGLVSISFFFAALILAFSFRIQDQPSLGHFPVPPVLWASTGILVLSSALLEMSRRQLRRGQVKDHRTHLTATLCCATLFLILQGVAGYQLLTEGAPVQGNPRASMYYVFMVLHAAHLLGGFGWLLYLQSHSSALLTGTETELRNHRRILSAAAVYWHFMGALWLVLFLFLRFWSS